MPLCAFYNVAHTVDHAHLHFGLFTQSDFDGFVGDELRFRCHNGFSGGTLGQFILCALLTVHVFDVGDDQQIHKLFNKSRLTGSYRAYNADVNIAVCTGCYVLVYVIAFHGGLLLYCINKIEHVTTCILYNNGNYDSEFVESKNCLTFGSGCDRVE